MAFHQPLSSLNNMGSVPSFPDYRRGKKKQASIKEKKETDLSFLVPSIKKPFVSFGLSARYRVIQAFRAFLPLHQGHHVVAASVFASSDLIYTSSSQLIASADYKKGKGAPFSSGIKRTNAQKAAFLLNSLAERANKSNEAFFFLFLHSFLSMPRVLPLDV